jgi:hypothetical protein
VLGGGAMTVYNNVRGPDGIVHNILFGERWGTRCGNTFGNEHVDPEWRPSADVVTCVRCVAGVRETSLLEDRALDALLCALVEAYKRSPNG